MTVYPRRLAHAVQAQVPKVVNRRSLQSGVDDLKRMSAVRRLKYAVSSAEACVFVLSPLGHLWSHAVEDGHGRTAT
jgi:hypothetical protein